ncbi:MAG TPA: aliphatic sulfonate ABC transporter substrate-binding protein [Acetobacteraceae bacterium]
MSHKLSRRTLLAAPAILLVPRARAATTLRVGDQKGGVQAVMKAAGVLEDLPYRLEWNQFAAAAPVLEALNAGAVDTAFAGDAPVTFALAQGVPARIVAAVRGTARATAIVVPGASTIRKPEDLRGKRIGTNRGSIGHALVLAAATRYGWSTTESRIVNLLPSDAKAALAGGSIDAWSSWNTYIAQAVLADDGRVVLDGAGLLSGLSFQVARTDAIDAKRAELTDYIARITRARLWALDNAAAYAKALATEINVTERVALWSIETDAARPVRVGAAVAADQQRTADLYLGAKIIPQRLDVAGAFDSSFNPGFLA